MYSKLKHLIASQGLRQSFLTIAGNTLSTGIAAIAMILISRFLGPTSFGQFTVGFSLMMILSRVSDFGLNLTISQFAGETTDKKTINQVFSFVTKYKLIISLTLMFLGILIYRPLSNSIQFSQPAIILSVFMLTFLVVAYEQIAYMLQALQLFTKVVLINFIQAVVKLMGTLIFLWWNIHQPISAVWLYLLSPLTVVLLSPFLFPSWIKVNTPSSHSTTIKIFSMLKHTSVAFLATGIIENMDVLFVQKYLNNFETGIFSGASRISLMIILMSVSLSAVLNPRVSRYKHQHDINAYLKKAMIISGLALLSIIIIQPFRKWLILWTIGAEYLPGISVLGILLASSLFYFASIPFIALFFSFKKHHYFSLIGVVQMVILLVGNLVFVPKYGLEAAAFTKLAIYGSTFILSVLFSLFSYRSISVREA